MLKNIFLLYTIMWPKSIQLRACGYTTLAINMPNNIFPLHTKTQTLSSKSSKSSQSATLHVRIEINIHFKMVTNVNDSIILTINGHDSLKPLDI